MAISSPSLLSFSLGFLLLCHGSLASGTGGYNPWASQRRLGGGQSECRIERLSTLEPTRRFESEAGVTEFFDETNEQLDCAGVSVVRWTIQPGGLLLPTFSNAPTLIYIIQGRGMTGTPMPGCPETFQSFRQSEHGRQEGQSQRFGDQHQRIHRFRQGDVLAIPAGVSHWCYNDGDSPVVAIAVMDTSNNANQLGRSPRQFLLAGRRQRGQQQEYYYQGEQERRESSGNNIFSGFNTETLAEALSISRDLARRLQGENDRRGQIVRVKEGLRVLSPSSREESREDEEYGRRDNGLEEPLCNMKIRENIGDASRADVYNPNGGRITSLNSQKLPILRYLRLSAERGNLQRNAFYAPHWNINAHSIMYVTRGRCRCQIVGDQGQTAFNGELRRGQLITIPQNYVVLKQAQDEEFEWVSFKTNDNAMVSQVVGKASALRGMPEDVIMNSFRISRDEARMVKENRGEETAIFSSRHQGRASA